MNESICENTDCQDTDLALYRVRELANNAHLWKIDPNDRAHRHSQEWRDGYARAIEDLRLAIKGEIDPADLALIHEALGG